MKQVNVALAGSGPDHNTFLSRAKLRGDKGYVASFVNGQQIIDLLIKYSKDSVIKRVDIFGHGWDCGVRGQKDYWNGLYVDKSKPIPDDDNSYTSPTPCVIKLGLGGTYAKNLADAIIKEKILIRAFGEISFWSCDGFEVALNLCKVLSANITLTEPVPVKDPLVKNGKTTVSWTDRWFNRRDIIVVGAKGSVVPEPKGKYPEKGARAEGPPDASFYFLQDDARVKAKKNPRLFTDATPEFSIPYYFALGLPQTNHKWMVGPQFDQLNTGLKQFTSQTK
jgi:hypothetical protein